MRFPRKKWGHLPHWHINWAVPFVLTFGYLISMLIHSSTLSHFSMTKEYKSLLYVLKHLTSTKWQSSSLSSYWYCFFYSQLQSPVDPYQPTPTKFHLLWVSLLFIYQQMVVVVCMCLFLFFNLLILQEESDISDDGCCSGLESEECLTRRFMAEHTDYIYTQDITGPWYFFFFYNNLSLVLVSLCFCFLLTHYIWVIVLRLDILWWGNPTSNWLLSYFRGRHFLQLPWEVEVIHCYRETNMGADVVWQGIEVSLQIFLFLLLILLS